MRCHHHRCLFKEAQPGLVGLDVEARRCFIFGEFVASLRRDITVMEHPQRPTILVIKRVAS